MTQNAHAYIRFSHLDQREGTSVSRQRGDCLKHAEAQGWEVTSVMVDEGKSAFSGANRQAGTELGRFVADALAGLHYGCILLVERIDRLSRQGADDSYNFIKLLGGVGVSVACVDGSAFYRAGENLNLIDVITLWIKAEMAREESVKKADRLRSAHAIRREEAATKDGFPTLGSACPAWLAKVDRQYVERPERVALIRETFRLADDGQGSITIAKIFNKRGEPLWQRPKGKAQRAWDSGRIRKFLTDPAVIGEYHPHEWVNGKFVPKVEAPVLHIFPRIIDVDVFQRVRDSATLRAQTKGGGNSSVVANLVSSLLRCKHCGGPMVYYRNRPAGALYKGRKGVVRVLNHENATLYCKTGKLHGEGCQNRTGITYLGFERALLGAVLDIALDDRSFANDQEMMAATRDLAERKRELEQAKASAEALWEAWADDTSSAMRKKLAEKAEAKSNALAVEVETLTKARARASGKVSEVEHLSRIEEVRSHLYDDDLEVRAYHRRKTMEGLRGIVTLMEADDTRTVTVGLAGSLGALRIHGGKVVEAADAIHMFADGNFKTLGGEAVQKAAAKIVERVGDR